jgi:hypothetical protein
MFRYELSALPMQLWMMQLRRTPAEGAVPAMCLGINKWPWAKPFAQELRVYYPIHNSI